MKNRILVTILPVLACLALSPQAQATSQRGCAGFNSFLGEDALFSNVSGTLPAMVYDRRNPEDIDPNCEEHAVKALMYGLTRRKIACRAMRVRFAV